MPNQTDLDQITDVQHTDLPPLPDFMNVPATPTPTGSPITSATPTPPATPTSTTFPTTPSDLPPVMATPKKKFGGGKIIATILGLVLLVGGVGAGVVLTQQQQLFQPKAYSCGCSASGHNASGFITSCSSNAGADCPGGSSPICYIQNQGTTSNYCSCGCHAGGGCTPNQTRPCGNGGTQTCVNGSWGDCGGETPTCVPPTTSCSGTCVNLTNDNSNCGSCGHSCGGASCNNGSCASSGGDRSCTTINTFQCNGDLHEICRNTASGLKWSTYEDCTLTTQTCGTKNDGSLGCIPKSGGGNTCTCVNGSVTANSCTTQSNAHCTNVNECSCSATGGGNTGTCTSQGGTCMVAGITGCSAPGKIHVNGTCLNQGNLISCCRNPGTGDNAYCSQVGCAANSCSVPSGLYPTCYVNHYWCQTRSPQGCSSNLIDRAVTSASFSKDCGTEQIDVYCPTCGATGGDTAGGNQYVSKTYASDCGGTPSAPSCMAVNAYDASWGSLTKSQLSLLAVGAQVNFCVSGSAPSGTFDKAQFKINTTLEPETTTQRPGSSDYCQSYTILSTDTTVNVQAKIHHTTLGWFGESI